MTVDTWDPGSHARILNALPEGIYVTDLERRILFWSKGAEAITGWNTAEIVGRSCFDRILAHEDLDGNALCGEDSCPLHRAITHAEPSTLPVLVFARAKNGRRIPVEVSVAPIYGNDGAVIGGIESFRDLSRLMQDLERAQIIQKHAMQSVIPSDPRIEFAVQNIPVEYVSGDFYHIEQVNPDTYAIMLADVTGHGVAAGLYTMQLRSLWEDSRELLLSPSDFLAHMNKRLFELTREDDSFATGFYGILNIAQRQLHYVLAGHPSPFLLRNGTVTPIDGRAPAIGLLPDSQFEPRKLTLQPGDGILLYSDGAIEITDQADKEMGEDALADLVQQNSGQLNNAALQKIIESILTHTRHSAFNDDVTLLSITLQPPQA